MEWIDINDRLPEETQWVLVYADGAMNCMAFIPGRSFEDWTNPQNPNVIERFITHWMPLPEPPGQQSNLATRLRELAVELNWRSIQLASIAQRKDFDRWMARAEKILFLVEKMPGWADELEKDG